MIGLLGGQLQERGRESEVWPLKKCSGREIKGWDLGAEDQREILNGFLVGKWHGLIEWLCAEGELGG